MNRAKARLVFLLIAIVCLFSCKKYGDKPNYDMSISVNLDTIINITSGTTVVKGIMSIKASEYKNGILLMKGKKYA